MNIKRAYKYRIYPTAEQEVLLNKHFGCCRLVYNLALQTKINAYSSYGVNLSRYDLQFQAIDLKNEFTFLKECSSQSYCAELLHLDRAYRNFFRGKSKFPRFKSKSGNQSYQSPDGNRVDIEKRLLSIPKFRSGIKIRITRSFAGKVKSVAISKAPTGKYFASILVDTGIEFPAKPQITPEGAIGIDLGISHLLITSTGIKFENQRNLKRVIDRIKVLQRRKSRKKKGSKNSKKMQRRIAVLHERVANRRIDYLHKVTTKLINDNQIDTICMEDLSVKNMLQNRKLSQAISDASWNKIKSLLKYKCEWYGKNLILIGRFEPSSKMCHKCGLVNKGLTLGDREWKCSNCEAFHDRDINAAINIKNIGLNKSGEAFSVVPVELSELSEAVKQKVPVGINATPTNNDINP